MRVRSATRTGRFAQDSTAEVQDLLNTRGVGSDAQPNRTRQEGPYPQQRVMQQIGRQMNRVIDNVDCAADPRFAKRAVGPCAARTCNDAHPLSFLLLLNRFASNRFGKAGFGWLSRPAGVGLLMIAVLLFGTDSTVVAQTFCDYLSGRSPSYQWRVASGFGRNNPTPRYPAAPWERVGVIGYAQPPAAIPPAIPATTSPPVISIPGPPTSPTVVPAPVGTPRPTVPGAASSLQPTSSLPLQASTTTVPSAATRCGYPGANCSQPGLAGFPAAPTTTAYAPQPTSAQPAYSQPSSVQPTYSQPAAPQPTQTVPAQAYPSPATSYPPTTAAPGLAPASAFQPAVATTNPVVSAAYPGSTVAAPPTYATFLPVSSTPPANAGLMTTYAAPQTIAVIPITAAMPVAPVGTAYTLTGCQSPTNSTSLSLFRPTIRGFRSTLAQVPVTRWRPVLPTVSGISVGRAPLQPCNSYEWQVRRVPTWGDGSPAGLIPVVVGQDTAVNMLGQRGTNALGAVPLYTTPIISGQTGMVVPSAGVPTVSTTANPVPPSGMAVTGTGAVAAPNPGANVGLAPNPLYGGATTGVVPGSAIPAAASNNYPSGTVPPTMQPPAAVAPRLAPGEVPAYRPILGSSTNGTYSAGYPTVNQGPSTGGPSWPPIAEASPTAYPNAPANTQPSGPQTATVQPAFSQPNYSQPAPPQPGYSQSTNAQSAYSLPTYGQPAYGQPAYGQPSYPQAAITQPTPTQPNFPETNTAQPAASQPGMMPFQAVQSNMQAVGSAPAAPTHAAYPNSVYSPPSSNSYTVGSAGGVAPSATSQPFGTSYSTPAGQPAVAPSTQQPAVVYPTPNQAPANVPTAYSSGASQANSFPAANGGLSTVAPVAGAQPYSGTATYPAPSTTLPGTISGTNGGLGAAAAPASSPRNYYNVNPVPDPEAGLRSVPVSPSQVGPTSTSSPNQSGDTRFPAGMYVPISWPANPPTTTLSPMENGVTRVNLVPTQAADSLPFAQPVTSLPQVASSTPPQPSPSPSLANRLPVVPTPTPLQPGWDDSNWNATW